MEEGEREVEQRVRLPILKSHVLAGSPTLPNLVGHLKPRTLQAVTAFARLVHGNRLANAQIPQSSRNVPSAKTSRPHRRQVYLSDRICSVPVVT